jgi:hypothetical protein
MLSKRNETTGDLAALRERLKQIYWIAGGSGAGKTTIARRLAAQHGLPVYATDDAMADHANRSSREDCPLLHRFMEMDMDERWVNRDPKTMFETFHWFRGEAFNMIIDDLLRFPQRGEGLWSLTLIFFGTSGRGRQRSSTRNQAQDRTPRLPIQCAALLRRRLDVR